MSTYVLGGENILDIIEHHVTRLESKHQGGWKHN
jgi:hypothetical protein